MQQMGLRSLIRAKRRYRHTQGPSDVYVPNVLQRDFHAETPNQKWASLRREMPACAQTSAVGHAALKHESALLIRRAVGSKPVSLDHNAGGKAEWTCCLAG